jgi:hypothetical protein
VRRRRWTRKIAVGPSCNAPFCDCGFENWTWGDEYRLAEKRDVSARDFWDALRANQVNGGMEPDSKPTSRNDP